MPAIPPRLPYQIKTVGDCTLVLGDCRKYIPSLEWHSIDLLVTDPPYGISYQTNYRVTSDTPDVIAGDECLTVFSECLDLISGKLSRDGAAYCFCSPSMVDTALPIVRRLWNVKNLLVWDKTNWGAGDLYNSYGFQYEHIIYAVKAGGCNLKKRSGDVLRIARVSVPVQGHPNQKPDKLLSLLIENSSDEGDLVVDPFMGSGRVGVCCARLGRRFIGCEIDPGYYRQSVSSIMREYEKLGYAGETPDEFNGGAEL